MRALGSAVFLAALCIGVAPSLHASVSFSSGGTTCGSSLCYSGSGLNVIATGLSATFTNVTNSSYNVGTLSTTGTSITQYTGFGLGVCDPSDSGCAYPDHSIDNNGGRVDFVLLQLSVPLTSIQLTLSPFNSTRDMDTTVITGFCNSTCSPNLLSTLIGQTPTAAGLSAITTAGLSNVNLVNYSDPGTAGQNTNLNVTLTGLGTGVNWVLIGASDQKYYGDSYWSNSPDYFKLNALNGVATPEPATFILSGSALLALGLLRRKKKLSADV